MFFLYLKIFLARILDVSLGTFRTIVLVKGHDFLAGIIGFFEVLIWFVIVQEILSNPENTIFTAVFYSLGFAIGTIIGAFISNKFINTLIDVQIITDNNKMANFLRKNGYGVTVLEAQGKDGVRDLLLININDKAYKQLLNLIRSIDKNAFIVVDEKKYVHNGFFLRK